MYLLSLFTYSYIAASGYVFFLPHNFYPFFQLKWIYNPLNIANSTLENNLTSYINLTSRAIGSLFLRIIALPENLARAAAKRICQPPHDIAYRIP